MPPERLHFRDIRRISSFRLTLVMGSLFLVGVIALLGLIYALTARELTARSDDILRDQARQWLAIAPDELPARIATDVVAHKLDYGALYSADGDRVVGNIGPIAGAAIGKPVDGEATASHGPLRLLAVRTANGETVLVGRDISQIRDLRERILAILLASGLATTLGIALAAVALSREPLRRVRDLQESAHAIVAGRLDVRMPVSQRHDELDQFAATVNVMVEDVTRMIEQVKGVTDAIAHDLRTPLTRVRAQLHRARTLTFALADPDAIEPLLASAEANLEAALDRFAALLRVSEIEAGARRAAFGPTDLARLLGDVAALYEPLAEDRGVALSTTIATLPPVMADRHLLFEALGNLVDNAIKFARHRVSITAERRGASIAVEISDDGPGIDPEERRAVLRRFHRGAKAAGYPGTGLGLSVVAAIVQLHRFELTLDDAAPGLRATLLIPIESARPEPE